MIDFPDVGGAGNSLHGMNLGKWAMMAGFTRKQRTQPKAVQEEGNHVLLLRQGGNTAGQIKNATQNAKKCT